MSVANAIHHHLGVELDEQADRHLKGMFESALEREDVPFSDLERARDELTERLPPMLEEVRAQSNTPSDQEVTISQLNAAMNSICPLWPIC